MNQAEGIVNIIFTNNVDVAATLGRIRAIGNVQWAQPVFGDYDAVAHVKAPGMTELQDTVITISKIRSVARTNTQIVFAGW